jgi:hypothetical protein
MRLPRTAATASLLIMAASGSVIGTATARAATVIQVAPGQSIQAAVDAAQPGDVIKLAPGTYQASVLIQTNDITIEGSGSGPTGTVIEPPAQFPDNACGTTNAAFCWRGTVVGSDGPTSFPTSFVDGGRLTGLRIAEGFSIDVTLAATNGAQVDHIVTLGDDSGGFTYDIVDVVSEHSVIEGNSLANAGHAAIYVGNYNVPNSETLVEGNVVTNGFYGIAEYDSQGVDITGNNVSDSCSGVMAYNDSLRVPGGDDINITGNSLTDNNAFCAAEGSFPVDQGSGVIVVGSSDTTVSRNLVAGNVGTSPLSGGIVVVSSRPYDSAEEVDESGVTVTGNALQGNGPDDLKWDGLGSDIAFTGNACATSSPAGLCP